MKQRLSLRTKMKTSAKVIIITTSVIIVFIAAFLFFNLGNSEKSKAASTITSNTSGNWNSAGTWVGGVVPTSADNVVIAPNNTVTLTASATCASLTINATTNSAALHINDATSLTVTGDVTINGGITAAKIGKITVTGNGFGTDGSLSINGNLNINGVGTSANAVLSMTGALSFVNLKGSINLASVTKYGTISCVSGSTFNFYGSAAQTLVLAGNGATDIVYGNIYINNSTGVTMGSDITAANVKGDVVIQSGKLHSGGHLMTLVVGKMFEIDDPGRYVTTTAAAAAGLPTGTVTYNFSTGSTIEFAGAAQTIPVLTSSYSNVIVSAAGTKSLAGSVTFNNTLTISNGYLDLNGYILTVNNALTTAVQRTAGGIISEKTDNSSVLKWKTGFSTGVFTVPFITSSGSYIPVTLTITSFGFGMGDFTFSTYPTGSNNLPYPVTPTSVTQLQRNGADNSPDVVDRFWEIDANNYFIKPTSTIQLTATSAEVGSITPLVVQRWNNATRVWDPAAAGQTATATSATVPNMTSYGVWTLVGKLKPLPVELLAFGGKYSEGRFILSWTTASEINNDYFTLERSDDGKTFTEIGRRKGTNKKDVVSYEYADENAAVKEPYYRLRQTDYDGKTTQFSVIQLKKTAEGALAAADGIIINKVFPNPFEGSMTVSVTTLNSGTVDIEVYDLAGKMLHKESRDSGEGSSLFELNGNLPAEKGVYMLVVRQNSKTASTKIIRI